MDYSEINKPISNTSFASKMSRAFYASVKTMCINGQVDPVVQRTLFLPDEIETFVLNSVVAQERDNCDMTDKQFLDVMNAIRNYQPPEFYEKLEKDRFKWILPTIGAVQFESQQYILFKLYRHHFIYTFVNKNVDVGEEFQRKFEVDFDKYASLVYIFHLVLAQRKISIFKNVLKKTCSKAPWFINNLIISRDEYRNELSQFSKTNADYRYCLRPSYSYPFIEYKGIVYLPTPHLLIQSITTAMMNRLTFGNNNLREKIGKNACEEYLVTIVKDSKLFDEVKSEYEYKKGQRTLDLLARKGDIAILFDSKLFAPKVSLRTYDESAYKNDASRMVKEVKQAYSHAHDKFNREYTPFSSDIKDIYALVVVYQEGYLDLNEIYTQVAEELSIRYDSEKYNWLFHHVGFIDVATIERFMLTKTDILPEIMNRDATAGEWLSGSNGVNLISQSRIIMFFLQKKKL